MDQMGIVCHGTHKFSTKPKQQIKVKWKVQCLSVRKLLIEELVLFKTTSQLASS